MILGLAKADGLFFKRQNGLKPVSIEYLQFLCLIYGTALLIDISSDAAQ